MNQDITLTAKDILRFLIRGLPVALLLALGLGFGAWQLASREDPVYEAEATVLVAQSSPDVRQLGIPQSSAPILGANAYRQAALSLPVLETAIASMGLQDPALNDVRRLRSRVTVQAEEERSSSLLFVRARSDEAEVAAARANAVAEALVAWDATRAAEVFAQVASSLELQNQAFRQQILELQSFNNPGLDDQIASLVSLAADTQRQLAIARALEAAATGQLRVLQPAMATSSPVAPRPLLEGVIAGLLGLMLGYGIMLLRAALDTRLRDTDDLARTAGLPVLAEVPHLQKDETHLLREATSYLRTNLLFSTADAHPKILLVTSAADGEGKTMTATSLAEGFVRHGYRTLLVDADLRSPSLARHYRIAPTSGVPLAEMLQDPMSDGRPVEVAVAPKQHLSVVPTFQPAAQPAELLSRGFRAFLDRRGSDYDVVIVDSAPVLAVADALAIAPFCTGTILVVNQQRTDRRQVRDATNLLERLGVRILGLVANHVKRDQVRSARYGYGYGAVDEGSGARRRPSVAPTGTPARRRRS